MRRCWFAVLLLGFLGAAESSSKDLAQSNAATVDPRLVAVLAAEESRGQTAAQLQTLIDATRADAPSVQAAAVRALGRLERRDVIPVLLPLLTVENTEVRSEAANAVAQSFRGEPLPEPTPGKQVDAVLQALLAAPPSDALYRSIGRLPYQTADQVRAAEVLLGRALDFPQPPASAARGLESLARLQRQLSQPTEQTIDRLRRIASRRTERPLAAVVRRNAMLALVASQGADAPTLEAALSDEEFEVRRLAALVLSGGGASLAADVRLHLLGLALQDRSPHVRLEAVRSWARWAAREHGCVPLQNALSDSDLHVVLAALDALGDQCRDDDQLTDRLASETRTPPAVGPWQREAHAFVSLAKRSRERAAIAMSSFAMHNDWQLRLYAARAAVAMDDVDTLLRLAADPDDNVVEATLAPLWKRLGVKSTSAFIAALNRRTRTTGRDAPARPYQVFRAAAVALEGAKESAALLPALTGALQRASEDRCFTSRDARLALIARILEFGSPAQAPVLTPLLRDIDPKVAEAAADAIAAWTGERPRTEPQPRQPEVPSLDVLANNPYVTVEMESGRQFRLTFFANQAPLSKTRFMRLVNDKFYNDLTFHRVVPNFVIQGGSPNANEYCGDCPYMRDEVGLEMHVRGTVGVSTRGRDTGDAQFFVNLVDTPRLDHEYTVFAYVCPSDMAVVDRIQEGDRMRRVTLAASLQLQCPRPE